MTFSIGDYVSTDYSGHVTRHVVKAIQNPARGCQSGVLLRVEPQLGSGWLDSAWFKPVLVGLELV